MNDIYTILSYTLYSCGKPPDYDLNMMLNLVWGVCIRTTRSKKEKEQRYKKEGKEEGTEENEAGYDFAVLCHSSPNFYPDMPL